MSQPTEGPAANRAQLMDEFVSRLNRMSDREFENAWANITRLPMRDRLQQTLANASARVHAVYQQTTARLSEAAQSLASQANQYRQGAVDRATQAGQAVAATYRDTRDSVVQGAQAAGQAINQRAQAAGQAVAATYRDTRDAVVERATQAGQQVAATYRDTRDSVVQGAQAAGQAINQRAQATGQAIAQGARATGQAVATGATTAVGAVAEGGRRAAESGQRMWQNTSRWFQTQKSRVQLAAQAAQSSFAATRFDPTVPQDVSAKDRAQLSQQWSQVMSQTNPYARLEGIQAIAAAEAQRLGVNAPTGPSRDAEAAARAAFGGVAPAGTAAPQQAPGTEQNTQGAQPNVNLNKPKAPEQHQR